MTFPYNVGGECDVGGGSTEGTTTTRSAPPCLLPRTPSGPKRPLSGSPSHFDPWIGEQKSRLKRLGFCNFRAIWAQNSHVLDHFLMKKQPKI